MLKQFALYIKRRGVELTSRCNASHGEIHNYIQMDTYMEQNKQ